MYESKDVGYGLEIKRNGSSKVSVIRASDCEDG